MAAPKIGKRKPAPPRHPARSIRSGGTRLSIRNSGREVWLYDEANLDAIRSAGPSDPLMGGAPPRFDELIRQGLLVGYSLLQDDDLEVEVHAGKPLTGRELAAARWLEPQHAFLRLPSGTLCIESNDASRIGPQTPGEQGGVVRLAAGDYRVTLYRIDGEALFREALDWKGPFEVIVLTPGGTPADAADDLLPFAPRRDTDWVGKYTIHGKKAGCLAWFDDYWDTFVVNLDAAAAERLSLAHGSYIRTHVPAMNLTMISAFAKSWDEAQRVPMPAITPLEEYGCAALQRMDEWNQAEALFCRRERAKARAEREYHGIWTPATVEVLDAAPMAPSERKFTATDLAAKQYFDSSFLAMVLSEVLSEAADLDELPMPAALKMLDRRLAKVGLAPQGDVSWEDRIRTKASEATVRLYTGLPGTFAAIMASDGKFELIFLAEFDDGTWTVTGLADEMEGRINRAGGDGLPVPHPRVRLELIDESLAKIFAAHKRAAAGSKRTPIPAPASLDECIAAFERFLKTAFT